MLLSLSRTCMTGAADIIIMSPKLEVIPHVLAIAKMTVRQAQWNIQWAFGYNVLSVALASGLLRDWGLVVDV